MVIKGINLRLIEKKDS